ncbi:hypothetical protein JCM18904_3762 [Vibrio sp. JCM 18904]|nr:hypothetical protein JCM18904_3762 [Vibrio sp. JCM 18904]
MLSLGPVSAQVQLAFLGQKVFHRNQVINKRMVVRAFQAVVYEKGEVEAKTSW